ncbi:MAG TPA: sensor domain-containing protein [Candidatus Limnocylindrales bacterium]|nr:sensor domain-containing protein [Candidatus Limnocylindrales bacterium]
MIGAPLLVLGLLVGLSAFIGARVAGRGRGVVADAILAPLHPATWAAAGSILVGLLVGPIAFGVVLALLSGGASLLVVGIGVVLIGAGIEAARYSARIERARARWADPRPLHAHAYRPLGPGLRELLTGVFLDVARWRDVVYVFVAFPLAVLEAAAVLTVWSVALAALSVPVWALAGEMPVAAYQLPVSADVVVTVVGLVGLVLLPIASVVTRGLMALHRAVVAGLLCESEQRVLERRVATLESSRRAVLDVEASELRRIERDLHDGAQQRLVMLAINLGLAAERIDDDPERARTLVADARDQARQALAELRDLVRGIAPAILLDRGLVPALSALAGRSPLPTVVASDLPDGLRLPDAVERAAYFVVAEGVANVAKHATAARCEIRCRLAGDRLVVEVEDDGIGGAVVVPGGGLAGLAGRVEALDGTLEVVSPAGGPTLVRARFGVGSGLPASPGQDSR